MNPAPPPPPPPYAPPPPARPRLHEAAARHRRAAAARSAATKALHAPGGDVRVGLGGVEDGRHRLLRHVAHLLVVRVAVQRVGRPAVRRHSLTSVVCAACRA